MAKADRTNADDSEIYLTTADDVKQAVKAYVEIGNELTESGAILRSMRKKRAAYEKAIFTYLKRTKTPHIELSGGARLHIRKTERRPAVNASYVAKRLESYYDSTGRGDDTEIKEIMKCVFNDRPVKATEKLKLSKAKDNEDAAVKYLD